MADYAYTTTEEMRSIDPVLLAAETANDPIFTMFPARPSNSDRLVWEQRDSYRGLEQIRGLNGSPPRVVQVGRNKYSMEPGVYGEYMDVDEMEMTRRASVTDTGRPVDIRDLTDERQEQLLVRQTNRMRWLGWELLVNGRFAVLNDANAVVHADAYTQQLYTAGVTWATVATATPIANFIAVSVLTRGTSASLGANADAWMNQLTFNDLRGNTNTADLGGKIIVERDRPRSVDEVNSVFVGFGLPRIRIYDEGYISDAGVWTPWIPNNRVVVVGTRTNGAPIGEMRLTRNVNNPNAAPGVYNKVIDHGERKVPRSIEVHRGWNGGPIVFYPGAICTMIV